MMRAHDLEAVCVWTVLCGSRCNVTCLSVMYQADEMQVYM